MSTRRAKTAGGQSAIDDALAQVVERLTQLGCRREELQELLSALRRAEPAGIARRSKNAPKNEAALKTDLAIVERRVMSLIDAYLRLMRDHPDLPEFMSSVGNFHIWLAQFYDGVLAARHRLGHRPMQSLILARLVSVVRRSTGQWRDEDVASLVACVRDSDYDTTTHSKWRERHATLIDRAGLRWDLSSKANLFPCWPRRSG